MLSPRVNDDILSRFNCIFFFNLFTSFNSSWLNHSKSSNLISTFLNVWTGFFRFIPFELVLQIFQDQHFPAQYSGPMLSSSIFSISNLLKFYFFNVLWTWYPKYCLIISNKWRSFDSWCFFVCTIFFLSQYCIIIILFHPSSSSASLVTTRFALFTHSISDGLTPSLITISAPFTSFF